MNFSVNLTKALGMLLLFSFSGILPDAVYAQPQKNEILWDRYGVPHIYAGDLRKMYYEFGWAQMHNHANLVLQLYGQARGRAAEYWGEKYLASDRQVLLFHLPSRALKEYALQKPVFRELLDEFVKGVNAYAAAHPEAVREEYRQVLPIRGEDVLAHAIRVIFLRFVAGDKLGMASRTGKAGSNAYAIGPSRSATRNALLLANPHLPWGDLFTFFEAQLQAPGFNAYGAAVIGLPVLNIAFNEHLGWTHTVNTIDACDQYELTLQTDGYLLDGHSVPFEKEEMSLKVKQADGSMQSQTMECLYSRHGAILGKQGDKAYAIRIAGMDNPDILYEWHRMAAASTWQQFEEALKMMQLPMFNVIYADEKGNIFYLFDGNVPQRREGDWKFWNSIVDGSYSKYIWQQTLSYNDLPKLFDPSTGFVQNANDPPWNCTYPSILDPNKFPAYLSPRGMALRPQRAVNMIRNDSSITVEKLAAYKLNTGMEAADRWLGALLTAAANRDDSLVKKAVEILKKWDKTTDADSRGAVLFARWFDKLNPGMFDKPWDAEHPLETPAGLKNAGEAVDLLGQAAKEVIQHYGYLDIPWGEVYRFRLNQLDYPANGGGGQYGVYRTIYFAQDADGKYRAVAGDSYVAITEFGKKVKAQVLLSYGNASQPGSKHAGDQLLLLSHKELRTAWLERKDVLNNLEEEENF